MKKIINTKDFYKGSGLQASVGRTPTSLYAHWPCVWTVRWHSVYWLADSGSDECLWKEQPNWRLLSCVGTAMLSPGKPSGSRSACTLAVTLLERLKRARLQTRRRRLGKSAAREREFVFLLSSSSNRALSSDDPPLRVRTLVTSGATRLISGCKKNPLAYDTPACANVTSVVIRVFTRCAPPPSLPSLH